MPLSRERIPIAAPIESRGSSWLTQPHWIQKFQAFVRSKPADHLNTEDVKGFLTDLAVRQNVAGAAQKSGIQRPGLPYRHVLSASLGRSMGCSASQEAPIRAGGAFARGG